MSCLDPDDDDDDDDDDQCTDDESSSIEIQNQILHESVPIVGTPYELVYSSDRVRGRDKSFSFKIPLTGASVPAGLSRILLQVDILGRRFTTSYAAPFQPNQFFVFQ